MLALSATRLAIIVSALLLVAGNAEAEIARALVKVNAARVFSRPDVTSPVKATLPAGTGVNFQEREPCDGRQEWCAVWLQALPMEPRGWIRAEDLFLSDGVAKFWDKKYEESATLLVREIRDTADATSSAWLKFFLAYSQLESGQSDQAIATFEQIAHQEQPAALVPLAYIAVARAQLGRKNLGAEVRAYEALLAVLPDYSVKFAECIDSPVLAYVDLCGGEPQIRTRVDAIRTFLVFQATAGRVIADSAATSLQRAQAWYDLGQAWERKDKVDPGPSDRRGEGAYVEDSSPCYEAAVKAAPGSEPAGYAAWRLIEFSEPYEWEGDIDAKADWIFRQYGAFTKSYPRHVLVGEAMFKLGVATWANAGYPELFGYIESPGTWADWKVQQKYLDQWFDVSGFGGGVGAIPPTRHPDHTVKARRIFLEIVAKYPATESAALAKYYSAVILDYCLNDKGNAMVEYQAFVRRYPTAVLYVEKANTRMAALRAVK